MDQKIAELTEKLYQEGVEKGEGEAKKIVEGAQEKADKIVADAKKEAERIIADADSQAEEKKRNVDSEIKLSGQQAISSIKQQILNLLTAKSVDENISKTLDDPAVVKDLLVTIVQNWQTQSGQTPSLEIILPETRRAELEKTVKGTLQKVLKDGAELSFSRNIKGGFQIGPKDGGYKISLTDEDFSEFIKEYLRPGTRAFLFGE
ncbi:MAG: V-type ATP synthase subunit E [Chitinivibrionales bacterium]